MSDPNPYASPSASVLVAPRPRWFRRDGKFIVVRTGAVLPARCVLTSHPGEIGEAKERELVWRSRWVQALEPLAWAALALMFWNPFPAWQDVLKGCLPVLILVFIARQKRFKVTFGLCRWEQRRKAIGQVLSGVIGIGGIVLCQMEGTWRDWLGVPMALIGIMASNHFYLRFPFRVIRHRGNEFWLKGASPEFLDSLEEP